MHKIIALLLAVFLMTPVALGDEKKSDKKASAAPAATASPPGRASAGTTEHGVFRVFARGESLGSETFEITTSPEGTEARAQVELSVGGQTSRQTARLSLGPAGLPRSYEWNQEVPKPAFVRVRFTEDRAEVEFPMESGSLDRREFFFSTPHVVILDNNIFHHFIFLLRHYDFTKGGRQTVSILIPQEVLPGTVDLEARGSEEVAVGNAKLRLERVVVISPDNEISVWVDEQKRVIKIGVPQAGVEVVRE